MNYNKWSMICHVQYMDLTLPVNIDELSYEVDTKGMQGVLHSINS